MSWNGSEGEGEGEGGEIGRKKKTANEQKREKHTNLAAFH